MPTLVYFFFFFNDTATTEIYTLSLHDALPISWPIPAMSHTGHHEQSQPVLWLRPHPRSEEHTSELQSQSNLVCRLLLEKKKNNGLALQIGHRPPSHSIGPLHFIRLSTPNARLH